MKTTLDLPADVILAARRRASEEGTTLRALVERVVRIHLDDTQPPRKRVALRWVTVDGGHPPHMNVADRGDMHDSLRRVH